MTVASLGATAGWPAAVAPEPPQAARARASSTQATARETAADEVDSPVSPHDYFASSIQPDQTNVSPGRKLFRSGKYQKPW